MSYTVHQAKTNLSKLIKEAESGKEVIITRGKQPVARLVPIADSTKHKRKPDMFKGQLWAAPDAFDPLTDEELSEWGLL
jgi:prevent-host-death family protein